MTARNVRRSAIGWLAVLGLALLVSGGTMAASEPFDSQRLAKAKDYIADEQWLRAIEELKAAAADTKEPNKDEALFWLAHSQNQARDSAAAIETIRRLERDHPASRWVKPARSLRVEIAQRLGRSEVLWYAAGQNVVIRNGKATMESVTITPAKPAEPATPVHGTPPPLPTVVAPAPPAPARGAQPPRGATPVAVAPAPPQLWFAETYRPDSDTRIQALQSLIKTDADKVIPILKSIALESTNPAEARRAVFVLAQANRPDARVMVVEVARTATEPVRIAAVRELGRLGGPTVGNDLLQVYTSATPRVRQQVVNSLGERAATDALYRIAESEKERELRDLAIRALGQAGGRRHLSTLYGRLADARSAIIHGLFNARGDEELIEIAHKERDAALRQEVLTRLRLLGTPQARQYLQTVAK
jgi:hypothetical protein